MATITRDSGVVRLKLTDFHKERGVIPLLKARVPSSQRRYDDVTHLWTFHPSHVAVLEEIFKSLGLRLLASDASLPAEPETPVTITRRREFLVYYIGECVLRSAAGAPRVSSSYGWDGLAWSFEFPEAVLRKFFTAHPPVAPPAVTAPVALDLGSPYATLGVKMTATVDEVKAAWRAKMKLYHPDINSAENAAESANALTKAWKILESPTYRRKLDVSMRIAGQFGSTGVPAAAPVKPAAPKKTLTYMPPVTCGHFDCDVEQSFARAVVLKIHAVEPVIVNGVQQKTRWDFAARKSIMMAWNS